MLVGRWHELFYYLGLMAVLNTLYGFDVISVSCSGYAEIYYNQNAKISI